MTLRNLRRLGALGAAAVWLGSIGCSGGSAKPEPPKAAAQSDAPNSDPKPASRTDGAEASAAKSATPTADPLFHPFAEAVRDANDPPAFVNPPADMTLAGKHGFQLLDAVKQHWNDIRFTTPDGKRIQYTAVLDTDYGPVEIELRPDVAPNHVRNFVALIQAGYYDGMRFDRIHHEISPDAPNEPLDYVEAGCPVDKGAAEDGSIGYWLQPEESTGLRHEVGAVGASHGREPDSAACKFYIMLTDAPYLDGSYTVFGKVTVGLDKVRKMLSSAGSRGRFRPTLPQPAQGPDHHPQGDGANAGGRGGGGQIGGTRRPAARRREGSHAKGSCEPGQA